MLTDRRRSPRVEILGRLHGHTVAFDVRVSIREISLGGMTVQTAVPLQGGDVHEFMLTLGDGSLVELTGRVLHSRLQPDATTDEPVYVSGVQFIEEELGTTDVVEQVIDQAR